MLEHIGKYYFDLVDHEKVQSFRVEKDKTFNEFKVFVICYFVICYIGGVWIMLNIFYG